MHKHRFHTLILTLCLILLFSAAYIPNLASAAAALLSDSVQTLAMNAIADTYPFDEDLYDIAAEKLPDGTDRITFRWRDSEIIIFDVTVDAHKHCNIIYNDTYSLENYYDELVSRYCNLFAYWPVEQKAQFAQRLPALCELERYRLLHNHPDWLWQVPHFAQSILLYQHQMPDETCLSQAQALQLATDTLINQHSADPSILESCRVAAYYLADDAAQPQWRFVFSLKSKPYQEIWVNARTGDICATLPTEAFALCREWLIQTKHLTADEIDAAHWSTHLTTSGTEPSRWVFVYEPFYAAVSFEIRLVDGTHDPILAP